MSNQVTESVYQIMDMAFHDGIIQNHTEDEQLDGRMVTLEGRQMVNFGSCAYLGIEHHPVLKQGVIEATEQQGVQFSCSRTFTSVGLIEQVEAEMQQIFGQPLIITASTTLGHLATLPVIVEDEDAVILDMQVHSSVQMAVQLLKARGISISIIRHNDMEALEKKLKELREKHKKIWYMADGVYSMYGDYAPLQQMTDLMERFPELHLYIDDAHGMGWIGENGIGYVRSQIAHHPRMVMVTSMNKSFSAAGGCIIFPNEAMRQKVLFCGSTLIFSGPIQPPMLGAALASAKLHQTEEILKRQEKLAELTRYMNQKLRENGLPQLMENDSPIFFIPVGLPRIVSPMVRKLKQDGFCINPSSFPAVPMRRGGLRFMTNCHLSKADIDRLVKRILVRYHEMMELEGITEQDIAHNFRIPEFQLKPIGQVVKTDNFNQENSLHVTHQRSIQPLDPAAWDALHADKGTLSHIVLKGLEAVFAQHPEPENQWDFHYLQVHDAQGQTVLSTFYTAALLKDDMFAPAAVSGLIEQQRRKDPYYLNSKAVMLGSMITKGEHLFLDRRHPQWKNALQLLIDEMHKTVLEVDATQLMLREFYGELDPELKRTMLDKGFTLLQLPNNMVVADTTWRHQDEFVSSLSSRYRSDLRREILKFEDQFEIRTDKPTNESELQQCYRLYCNVFERSLELNVHKLPLEYFRLMAEHNSFDMIRLYLKANPQQPVGVMFSYLKAVHITR